MTVEAAYPLVFTFPEVFEGNGFVARIAVHGRALYVHDADGEHWLYGVQPASLSGGGADFMSAQRRFKESYLSVIFDVAAEAQSFDAFKAELEQYFNKISAPFLADWKAALAEVREKKSSLEGLSKVNANERLPHWTIERVDGATKPSPIFNRFDEVAEAA